MEISTNNK